MTGEGIGFGKAILFNEHFVVYGVPAIVSAIGKYTIAKVEPTDKSGWNLKDNRKVTPNYKEDKVGQQKDSINRTKKLFGFFKDELKVKDLDTACRLLNIAVAQSIHYFIFSEKTIPRETVVNEIVDMVYKYLFA